MGWFRALLSDWHECLVYVSKGRIAIAKWILDLLTRLSIYLRLIISIVKSFLRGIRA